MSIARARRSVLFHDKAVKPLPRSAEIDWGHPLTDGLVSYILLDEEGGLPFDLASKVSGTMPSAYSRSATQLGYGVTCASSAASMNFTTPDTGYLGELTVVVSSIPTTATFDLVGKAATSGAVTNDPIYFAYADITGLRLYSVRANATAFRAWAGPTGALPALNQAYTVAVSWSSSMSVAPIFYVGGQPVGPSTDLFGGTGTGAPTGSSADLQIGPQTVSRTGTIYWSAIYSRQLTDSKLLWLHNEPYAMLRPIPTRIRYFVPEVVGGGRIWRLAGQGGGLIGSRGSLAG